MSVDREIEREIRETPAVYSAASTAAAIPETYNQTDTHGQSFRSAACLAHVRACNAKGDTCPLPAMANGKCYKHGGKTPSGLAAGRFTHGRHSKLAHAAPQYLSERMEQAMEDLPGLVDLSEALSLQWSTLADLLQKLPTGESGETWKALREHWSVYQSKLAEADKYAGEKRGITARFDADTALEQVGYLIAEGAQEWQQRREIGTEVDRLAGVAHIEGKRRASATDAMAMYVVKRLLHIIQENVTDQKDRAKIQREIQTLFTGK